MSLVVVWCLTINVRVQVDIFVEDEGEIAENDLVTIKVTLTRNNVPEWGKVQPVYAPKYPLFGDEGWWVLVGDLSRKTIFSFERITDSGRVVFKEVTTASFVACECCELP